MEIHEQDHKTPKMYILHLTENGTFYTKNQPNKQKTKNKQKKCAK